MATYKSEMGTDYKMQKFVPEIWTPRILKNLHDKQVAANYTTREYEGDLAGKGDVAKIHYVGAMAVRDYEVGTDITYDTGTDGEILVEIDTAKYFAFKVEDIEKAQSSPQYVTELSAEAAKAMAKDSDNYLVQKMLAASTAAAVSGGNKAGGSAAANGGAFSLTADDTLYESLVDMGVRLDDLLAPDEGRFIFLPSFAKGAILKDDRFVGNAAAGQQGARDKGSMGMIAGFEIVTMPRSTFVRWDATADADTDDKTEYSVVGGIKGSYAYVEQISKTENIRLEKLFADGVRGLHLYGGGAIRNEHLISGTIESPVVDS